MVAEAASRAARGHVLYLELMITPDGVASSQIGQEVGWDGNFEGTLDKLKRKGIAGAAATGVQGLQDAEAEKNRLLKCGTLQADQGCSVTIRYIYQVSRGAALGYTYTLTPATVLDAHLTWTRFVQQAGVFRMADGYPNVLTAAQAKFEMRNWDEVSLPSIMSALAELNDGVDYVLVLLIARRNIASGTTTIHALDHRELGSFTLTEPLDADKI